MRRTGSLALALVLGGLGCVEPSDSRPGLRLSGDLVTTTPSDWSFAEAHPEIALEVRTPYLLPHSVTIWCANVGPQLYVGARRPSTKRWTVWADRDPEVRLRIGDQLFEVRLAPVYDPAEIEAVTEAYAAKYDLEPPGTDEAPAMRYWTVLRR